MQSAIESGAHGFMSKSYEAHQIVEELELYLTGIMDFRNSAPIPTPETPSAPPPPVDLLAQSDFTKRERQIAELLKQGLSNKEISDKVFLSEGTVKNYMSQIFEKLEVTSRTQAVIKLNQ